uniref:Uncharacterized protein n=1 Tax=Nelumbo nucifera TaxID=4432 RepID=A0A822Y3G4_NELNU|nr:TPA_asm: hypothetical protein HUJ06_028270 [Nelumbo nucifera]
MEYLIGCNISLSIKGREKKSDWLFLKRDEGLKIFNTCIFFLFLINCMLVIICLPDNVLNLG